MGKPLAYVVAGVVFGLLIAWAVCAVWRAIIELKDTGDTHGA